MKERWLSYRSLFVCFLLLTISREGIADTPVSGPIVTNTIWQKVYSPYLVVGNVRIMSGVTLTIEAGVVVKFESKQAIQIDGTILARGTESSPIIFTSSHPAPAPEDYWAYIFFSNSSTDATFDVDGNYTVGSILEYCIIEYAGGVSIFYNGAVRMDNAHPFVNRCLIRNNQTSGICAWNLSGTIKITNNTVTNNTASSESSGGGGICICGGTAIISGNDIRNNRAEAGGACGGGGIFTFSNTSTIFNNTITNNRALGYAAGGGGGGIYICGGVLAAISCNIIEGNKLTNTDEGEGGGIRISYDSEATKISDNIIANNIAGKGGGIFCSGYSGISISHNVISNNQASADGGIYLLGGSVTDNSIIANSSQDATVFFYADTDSDYFNRNTITDNYIGTEIAHTVLLFSNPSYSNIFNCNNIFGNAASHELWNDNSAGSADVNAQNNWWGTAVESEIQQKIYDWFDDATKTMVDYSPWEVAIRTDSPISPPTGLSFLTTDTEIIISWDANPESDVAGYKVYWGTKPSPFFENVINVGNSLGHTIPALTAGRYYVGVTAYDSDYRPANDNPATIVNENQTNGNESWYASSVAFVGTQEPKKLTLEVPNGGEFLLAGNVFTIAWQSQGPVGNVLIKYSTDNGSTWLPVRLVANTGFYEWLIPAVISYQCLVEICDSDNVAIRDTSDDVFTIVQCTRLIPGDLNKDCYVDFYDLAVFAQDWLECSNPIDPICTEP